MAISTYAELKVAIGNWLGRDDIAAARISEFVALFEAVANRALRVRQQESSSSLTLTTGDATLPTDYLAWRRVQVTSGGQTSALEYVTPEYMTGLFPSDPDGVPRFFTIIGSTLTVRPIPSGTTVDLDYLAKIPELSDSATTNWLLTSHPDLYLYGSLVESEMFLVNDERALSWKSRRDELFEEIRQLSNRSRGRGAVRVMAITP